MTNKTNKKYLIAVAVFTIVSISTKFAFEYSDRIVGLWAILLKVIFGPLLILSLVNFGYQFYKINLQGDEFMRHIAMKGACFGGLMTGVLSWFYWCLGSTVPQYQADWPFFMLLLFTAIGHAYFLRKAS